MAADLEKIAADAKKITELEVDLNQTFTMFAKAFHATQDAVLQLAEDIEEEATGGDNGDGNGGNGGAPDLERGLLWEQQDSDVAPFEVLPPFSEEVVTVSFVMDLEDPVARGLPAVHQKAFCIEDAFSIGLNMSAALDVWNYAGTPPTYHQLQDLPKYWCRKASWVLYERSAEGITLRVDGAVVEALPLPAPLATTIGKRVGVGKGYWKGEGNKDPIVPPGRVRLGRCWSRRLSVAEKLMEGERTSSAVEAEPTPLEEGGLPQLNIQDAAPTQGVAKFPVTLSVESEAPVAALWSVSLAGGAAGKLVIPPGDRSLIIEVAGAPVGTFTVTLSAPENATIGRGTASGKVLPRVNGGTGEVGPIQEVDRNYHAVEILVHKTKHQPVLGTGWGTNSTVGGASSPAGVVLPRLRPHIEAVTSELGCSVIRVLKPEDWLNTLKWLKPYYDLGRPHGIKWVFGTGFVHRVEPDASMAAVARGLAECWKGGLPIHYYSKQNEPEGNPANAVPGGAGRSPQIHSGNEAAVAQRYRDLDRELHRLNVEAEVVSYEWRHPPNEGLAEHDAYRRAGLIPDIVKGFCFHNYDKSSSPALYDDRWLKGGVHTYSIENGNNGTPAGQMRALSDFVHGARMIIMHYVMIATPTPNSEQLGQAFLDWNGRKRPWWAAYRLMGQAYVPEGTVMRRTESSDRWGIPEWNARWMVRSAPQCGGFQPRQEVTMGAWPDGKTWVALAGNSTHGEPTRSPYTHGHDGKLKQQITMRVEELKGKSGVFQLRRASMDGVLSGPEKVNLVDGTLRFKVEPGETVNAVGQPA